MDGLRWHKAVVVLVVSTLVSGLAGVQAQETIPFRTRNLSPVVAIFGLPVWEGALGEARSEFGAVAEVANHYRLSRGGAEELILDGETWRTGLFYRRRVGEEWTVGVEVPLYRISGGFLDDGIDAWHSFFNLPDGERNQRPEDQLRFLYNDRGVTEYFRQGSSSGLGDIQLSAAREIDVVGGLLLRAVLKLPTGDADTLFGSGAADVTVTVLKQSERTFLSDPAGIFWGGGVMLVGEPDVFAARSEDLVVVGLVGGSWRPLPQFGLKAQLEFNTPFYDSDLDEFGKPSVQASFGGWWSIDDRRRLDIVVGEDFLAKTAPDVTFHVGFNWGF